MATRFAAALLLVLLVAAAPARPQLASPGFSASLPPGIADVSGWELVSGDFETAQLRGGYRFYVNPERSAMYQLMRYRVQRLPSAEGPGDAALGTERVVFVRRPGVREPIDCWERQPPGAAPEWRPLVPGTPEYGDEMMMLTRVLAVHRAAHAAR